MGGPDLMRATPVQARAAARVERLLDVTAALLDEKGYEALTTAAVAQRSGMSIGSVYRYFPDRRSLVKALAQRNLDRYSLRVLSAFAQAGPRTWWHLTETAIDAFVAMHREEPGFRFLRFGDVIDELLLDEAQSNNAVLGDGLVALGVELLGLDDTDELRFATDIVVHITDALLHRGFFADGQGDERIIAECKRIVRGYLAEVLGEPEER